MSTKFWSDDFDMDLLKLFPSLPKMLADSDLSLWTVGGESFGRLNHPVIWNTHGAFVWREKPNLDRDKHGWFNIRGCVSDHREIECTWLELLRDAWPHHYAFILFPDDRMVPPAPNEAFMTIMYDLRGWQKSTEIELHRAEAMRWIMRCDRIINEVPELTTSKQVSG